MSNFKTWESALVRACRFGQALALAMVVAGCARAGTEGRAPLRVTGNDAGATLELAPGQALLVSLSANHSTGYSWALAAQPDVRVLRSGGPSAYRTDAHAAGMVGAGGTETWSFSAVGPGQGELRFAYRRPWEQGIPPIETARYTVRVK